MRRSKTYKEKQKLIDKKKNYTLEEALDLLPKLTTCKFDASVELHINLNLTEKEKNIPLKESITLPNQSSVSKTKVAVITTPDHVSEAKEADFVGEDDLIKKIKEGFNDFDVVIATPEVMPKIAILGKILGPRGKMPNPKNNTVTSDLKKIIQSYKKGKMDFRADDAGGIHVNIGKISMKKENLKENLIAFIKSVIKELKNQTQPFKSVYIAPAMGPSVKLDLKDLMA
jgi:large subunit ribosomal protein L1